MDMRMYLFVVVLTILAALLKRGAKLQKLCPENV